MKNPFAIDNFMIYLKNKYPNYHLLDGQEYTGCRTKMKFICDKHIERGIQYNFITNIVDNGHVCKYCSYDKLSSERTISVEKAKELCNERDVLYFDKYTKENETMIQYKCINHDFDVQEMSLSHFKESKHPCRYCIKFNGEIAIQDFLIKNNIPFVTQKTFNECVYKRMLKFDFYIPSCNYCIEYDGQQHFEPVKFKKCCDVDKSYILTQVRDKIKNEYCNKNNIKLIRIPYWEYNNIENILASELSDAIFV